MGRFLIESGGELVYISSGVERILEDDDRISISEIKQKISDFERQDKSNIDSTLVLAGHEVKYRNYLPGAPGKMEEISRVTVLECTEEIDDFSEEINTLKTKLTKLQQVFNNAYEALVIVDTEGYITEFNHAYEECLGLEAEDVIGRHVTDVIDNTRLHLIAKSGEAEIGHLQNIQGEDMITSRIPLEDNGELIGVAGKILFEDIRELKAMARRLEIIEDELDQYKNELKRREQAKYTFSSIITRNEQMQYLKDIAKNCASSSSTVLLIGESGTGKEMFAHAIHKAGVRKYGAFVGVNCAAIPENLLESELFGYEEGAFTGARAEGKPGKFELADGGTIFLDEITSMSMEMQAKILRVLQEKEIHRVGGTETKQIDMRVIAATNKDIESLVAEGKFRQDLYYRLNVIRLQIPPLRDRKEDIPLLADHILSELAERLNKDTRELSPRALELLDEYDWPGNVRELYNFLERAVNLSSGQSIKPEHLPEILADFSSREDIARSEPHTPHRKNRFECDELETVRNAEDEQFDLSREVSRTEKRCIRQALDAADGNKTEAARILGIHRNTLYNKIEKYNLED